MYRLGGNMQRYKGGFLTDTGKFVIKLLIVVIIVLAISAVIIF